MEQQVFYDNERSKNLKLQHEADNSGKIKKKYTKRQHIDREKKYTHYFSTKIKLLCYISKPNKNKSDTYEQQKQ